MLSIARLNLRRRQKPSSTELLSKFLRYLQADANSSPHTIKAYRSDLTQFLRLNEANDLDQMSEEKILEYLAGLRHSDKDTTLKRKLASLRRFFSFLEKFGYCPESPAAGVGIQFRTTRRLPRVMPISSVKRLLNAPQMRDSGKEYSELRSSAFTSFLAIRNSTILGLLFFAGLRVGEIVATDIPDVTLENATLLVHGKGRKERILYVKNRRLTKCLCRYMVLRRRMGFKSSALFVNRSGGRLSVRSIEMMFGKYLLLAGINDHFTPHSLRHTMATRMVEDGVSLRTIQEILGHSSIMSTQVYTHVAPQQIERALARLGRFNTLVPTSKGN